MEKLEGLPDFEGETIAGRCGLFLLPKGEKVARRVG
jgi:hypothetical protein